ncbi:hypothetical protein KZZ52_41765 [Dactylosporangium sp. AC04546]|uniref:hypothetical protein n=1 Tax=Dactylosporangium sp. AC04546 TaxID=2862460 RepID=UPI002E7BC866|nr:hypothetical protein [Dactylosporangium sp. AC04546]WVK80454.1 hypothetical protein KZZ52_41765 [Dactylosporangium sp. AC04546]
MDAHRYPMNSDAQTPRGLDRRHQFPGRRRRVNLRFDEAEHHDVVVAADRTGLTPAGFCADAALAAARGAAAPGRMVSGTAVTRHELAELQRDLFAARTAIIRTGTNLNQAVAALNATGEAPVWLGLAVARCERALGQLDAVVGDVDRRLR